MKKIQSTAISLLMAASFALAKEYVELQVEDFSVANFTQKVDHFTPADDRTYNQRYWWNDTFWDKQNGPIFL
jgi:hypothetical protein